MSLEDFINYNAEYLVGFGLGLFTCLIIQIIRDLINLASWQRYEQPTEQPQEVTDQEKEESKEGSDENAAVGKKEERRAPDI